MKRLTKKMKRREEENYEKVWKSKGKERENILEKEEELRMKYIDQKWIEEELRKKEKLQEYERNEKREKKKKSLQEKKEKIKKVKKEGREIRTEKYVKKKKSRMKSQRNKFNIK